MCNLYDIGPTANRLRAAWEKSVNRAVEGLEKDYVAPGRPGVIVRLEEGELEASVARWGFRRKIQGREKDVNNARIERLPSGMWTAAWRSARCLIPLRRYYEPGPRGSGIRYAVHAPSGEEWLYAAGIWEDHPELGPSFSMITRESEGLLAAIHHRMPTLVEWDAIKPLLEAERPSPEILELYRSPLAIGPPPGEEPGQLSLFEA